MYSMNSIIVLSYYVPLALQKQTPGFSADLPALSCADIFQSNSQSLSGYYWIQSCNGSVYIYCDMTLTCKGVSGGWMQVVKLDMTNSSHQCPPGTTLRTDLPKRLCGIGISGEGCSSTTFDTYIWNWVQPSLWEDYWISGWDSRCIWSSTVTINWQCLCWGYQSHSWQQSLQAHLDLCSSPWWSRYPS